MGITKNITPDKPKYDRTHPRQIDAYFILNKYI
jgi:hypothetical protein